MSGPFTATLFAVIGLLLGLRLTIRRLPIVVWARPLSPGSALLCGLAVVGLVLHCTAMFDRALIELVPGTSTYIRLVNEMGRVSVMFYALPAAFLLVGFHQQRWPVQAVLAGALMAVGITMYDQGSVTTHLASIFVAAVSVSVTLTFLVTKITFPNRRVV